MGKRFTPREYQELIRRHIFTHDRCAVWAGMGMGKTSASLSTIADYKMIDDSKTLVLAPLRVAQSTWPDEVAKWDDFSGLRISPIVGSVQQRLEALHTPADIYTMNYENLEWLVEACGKLWPFPTIFADESTKLKSFRTRQGGVRAKALAQVAHRYAKRFIELTGTPSPNGYEDLWGQLWFLDGGQRLGRSFTAYIERFFQVEKYGYGKKLLPFAQEQIHALIDDLCLTINAKDWFDLKDPIVTDVLVTLPPRARQLYKDMERTMFMQLEEHNVEAFNAAARTQKLLQLASGAVYVDPKAEDDADPRSKEWKAVHDLKLDALEDVIEEAAGMPVLVAYHFRSDVARLLKRFKNARVLDKDPATLRDWNAGNIPILLAHPQSAGHGLNLQDGGNILVFFSHNWNLEERLQIIERIGPVRQLQAGYERPVFIYNIIARDTVDELVIARVESKREVQDVLLEAMKKGKA